MCRSKSDPTAAIKREIDELISEANEAKQIIYKHWHVLCSDPTLSTTFKDPPVCAFKRSKNLRDTLVHARSNPQPTTNTTNWLSSLPAPTD
ncbi:uncharacterized protein [Hyperolius riggenbachi]|uniref:uncharacterized protein isoform X4 n=1 Tax=Hyperolius riggenbachi TaxID=752182 RepID=UPI0035A2E668